MDFTDFNKTYLKDNLYLPRIDWLVEATKRNNLLLFMNVSLGYNQIFMYPEDGGKTVFVTYTDCTVIR